MEVIDWLYHQFFFHPIEVPALLFSLAYVLLAIRQSVLCWPCGVIGGALYAYVFFLSKFYAEMGTYVMYTALCVYGWHQWLHPGPERKTLPVTRTPMRLIGTLIVIGVVGAAVLGTSLRLLTDATFPYPDSTSSVFGLIAQWMTAKKLIENWHVWIAVNLIGITMFTLKGLYPTAVLYFIFLILSVLGYIAWRKSMQSGERIETAEDAE